MLIKSIKKYIRDNRAYFSDNADIILKKNRWMLVAGCILYSLVLCFYTIITLIDDQSPKVLETMYFVFDGAHVVLTVTVLLCLRRHTLTRNKVKLFCVLQDVLISTFFILEGAIAFPDQSAIYVSLALLLLIILIIRRLEYALTMAILYCGIFALLSGLLKTPQAFGSDLYISIATLISSLIGYFVISTMRQNESVAINRYKAEKKSKLLLLKTTAEEAIRTRDTKAAFFSQMTQDMRLPLDTIIGNTYLAYSESATESMTEYLQNIDRASNYLVGLMNEILDLSRAESGKMTLHEEYLDISRFINGIEATFGPQMKEKNIDFRVDLSATSQLIRVDVNRFNQIFYNLLSNAVKYTRSDGNVRFWSSPIPERDGKEGIRFHVKDDGIGMSEAFQNKIFNAFTQEHRATVAETEGTGLGLAIVKNLVDCMDGRILVKSAIDEGSEFIVDLYVWTGDDTTADIKEKDSYIDLTGLYVLLVDDAQQSVFLTKALLANQGCVVQTAKNGEEAINIFASSKIGDFDAILMNTQMPLMNGYEAARKIRQRNRPDAKTVPIIALTGNASSEDRQKALDSGMNECVLKPIIPKDLFALLDRHSQL